MTIENELRHVHAEGRMGRTPDFAAIAANITALSARAIELIRELCEEVVSLNSASWVAEVITVTEPGDKGVRIRWRGGFPQVGDKLYTTPRAASAVTDGDALFLLECADTLAKDFRHHMADKLREFVKQKALAPPSAKRE